MQNIFGIIKPCPWNKGSKHLICSTQSHEHARSFSGSWEGGRIKMGGLGGQEVMLSMDVQAGKIDFPNWVDVGRDTITSFSQA